MLTVQHGFIGVERFYFHASACITRMVETTVTIWGSGRTPHLLDWQKLSSVFARHASSCSRLTQLSFFPCGVGVVPERPELNLCVFQCFYLGTYLSYNYNSTIDHKIFGRYIADGMDGKKEG